MNGNHNRLWLLYLALCAAQLLVTAVGLVIAYQIEHSYSRTIASESAVNAEHRAVNELQVYARVASPENLNLDDETSGPSQLSQIDYSSKIFLKKAQALLDSLRSDPKSPLAVSEASLRTAISEMTMLADQSRLAGEAWKQGNSALARARLTYAERSAARVQAMLGNINDDMSRAKDEALAQETSEARRSRLILRPLSIVGILMVVPALLYARRLNRNILSYEEKLQTERNLLEERVEKRTAQLRQEIESRERMAAFDMGRNQLLEKVAEGKGLDDVLTMLALAIEQSVPDSRCFLLLTGSHNRSAIAPNVPADLAVHLESFLLRGWDTIPIDSNRECVMFRDVDPQGSAAFADAWSQGFRGLFAVPITEAQRPLLGVVAILLLRRRAPDELAREILLSASRVASVALKHDRMQDELFQRAHYDPLTDLPNRTLLEDRLQHAIALAGRRNSSVGILCIDLDGFKQVNDLHGHHAGDWLLQQVAGRLTKCLRQTDTVARLGGDEFIAIVHDTREGEGVAKFCEALVNSLAEPYQFGEATLRTTASIGAAMFPADGTSCADLRRHADLAMYRAKESGRNRFQMFSAELGRRLTRRKTIEKTLQDALDRGEFELHYQPICMMDGSLIGLEALIRLRSEEGREFSPAEFIPVAEQTGQVPRIGEWVLREACRQGKAWQADGFPAIPIAVNVSAVQLARADFSEHVSQILHETGMDPALLHLEVTETAIMSDLEGSTRQLSALAQLGVHISIDDFGTGHSSLSYIHRLPIKAVKIDRSFVQDIVNSYESKAIVRAITAMARSLELTVIAEGVETQEQLKALVAVGCSVAQGYWFARPLDRAAVGDYLKRGTLEPTTVSG